jgi:hypothetical protein
MNLRVFLLNESKHLEPSSQTAFFESFQDGKSYYWIDVEDPDPNFFDLFGMVWYFRVVFLVMSNYALHETTWELILRKEEDACEKNKFSD